MASKETSASPTAIRAPQHTLDLLNRLHQQSLDQEAALKSSPRVAEIRSNPDETLREGQRRELMKDKFIALEADKAALMYSLVRAIGATNVVEIGTSYGVSTIYLALAVGQNLERLGGGRKGRVVATEHEREKAETARAYWREAGSEVEGVIELREGDLRETLKEGLLEEIDFVLMDIWTPMVIPALDLLEPKLKPGAIILCDNVLASKDGYAEFFARIKGPDTKYKTVTLPYDGGLELVTYSP